MVSRRFDLSLILILSLVVGCQPSEPDRQASQPVAQRYGGVYRYVLDHEPWTLDPARLRGLYSLSLVQQLFDGLVQFDADLNVIPSIAKSWTASPDQLTWHFNLRSDVAFHHGRSLTVEDVVYSFTRLMHPETRSPYTWLFESVNGVEAFRQGLVDRIDGFQALGDHTLQITLSQPSALFIRRLGVGFAKIVPREIVERLGSQFGRQPVGTGPFQFVSWEKKREIRLQANEAYFEGRPYLDQLRYQFFLGKAWRSIFPAFERGELEDVGIPLSKRQQVIADSPYQFFRKPILATRFLMFNTHQGPLSRVKVRRAINYAIDHDRLLRQIWHNRPARALGVLPPGLLGYDPTLAGYPHNPGRARQQLAEAGYPGGVGLPTIELWTSASDPAVRVEHEAIQADLARVGISVVLRQAASWRKLKTKVLGKRPNAMYRYAWFADFPDPDNFLHVLFHSQGTHNTTHYANPEVDRLLEVARYERDILRRSELYRDAERRIVQDAPMVSLAYYTFERLFQPYVRGIEISALGRPYMPMKKIWLDKVGDKGQQEPAAGS